MDLALGADKSISDVLLDPAGMYLRPYFIKLTAKL